MPTPSLEELVNRRQRVLAHLMKSMENWRGSNRVGMLDETHLTDEERELKHAYDLLQQLISDIQNAGAGQTIDVTV